MTGVAVLVRALRDLRLDLEGIKEVLRQEFANAELISSSLEGVSYLAVQVSGRLVFDIRVTDSLVELYMNLDPEFYDNVLRIAAKLELETVSRELSRLAGLLSSLPRSLILSRVVPSRSVYVLLEPKDDFPPVKGVLSAGNLTIITPTCTIQGLNAKCDSYRDTAIAGAVVEILRALSRYID